MPKPGYRKPRRDERPKPPPHHRYRCEGCGAVREVSAPDGYAAAQSYAESADVAEPGGWAAVRTVAVTPLSGPLAGRREVYRVTSRRVAFYDAVREV